MKSAEAVKIKGNLSNWLGLSVLVMLKISIKCIAS